MSKHTPGPWFTDFDWQAPAIEAGTKSPYKYVALVTKDETTPVAEVASAPLSEVQKANARLIAAAPDLLEMLKEAYNHLDYCGFGDSWEREYAQKAKLDKRISAAIAKAEGTS